MAPQTRSHLVMAWLVGRPCAPRRPGRRRLTSWSADDTPVRETTPGCSRLPPGLDAFAGGHRLGAAALARAAAQPSCFPVEAGQRGQVREGRTICVMGWADRSNVCDFV